MRRYDLRDISVDNYWLLKQLVQRRAMEAVIIVRPVNFWPLRMLQNLGHVENVPFEVIN